MLDRASAAIGAREDLDEFRAYDPTERAVEIAQTLERDRRRRNRAERQEFRERMKPIGIEFLNRLLADPHMSAHADLRAIREFAARLSRPGAPRRGRRFLKSDAHQLEALVASSPSTRSRMHVEVERASAIIIYRVALLAGVSPGTVAAAIMLWGIEKMAADLRSARAIAAPAPQTTLATGPRAPITPAPQPAVVVRAPSRAATSSTFLIPGMSE